MTFIFEKKNWFNFIELTILLIIYTWLKGQNVIKYLNLNYL